MEIITLPVAASTNSTLASMSDVQHGTILRAVEQTAGRGQRGNTWEAEAGKNLTFSMLIVPEGVTAPEQFLVSQAVALAIATVLARHVGGEGNEISVKWPNDIYCGNRKICGILIENSLSGRTISRSIAGIGVNVNQLKFVSDAPNPVSIIQITGRETPLEPLMIEIAGEIQLNLDSLADEKGREELRKRFFASLWRRNGFYKYSTPSGEIFAAEITSVAPDGILTLTDTDRQERRFAFKEVQFLL